MIIIEPTGGLCNRLRVLFSYYKLAESKQQQLHVIWTPNEECPGHFLDYFETIKNVSFIQYNKKLKPFIMYKGCQWHPQYNPYQQFIYKSLRLNKKLKQEIDNRIHKLENNYVAVHIRRTDHIQLAKQRNVYTCDDEFEYFINDYKNVYIATDNVITYTKFSKKYKDRIKFPYHQHNTKHLRHTTLHDSIIDLFMCIHASHFKGSGYSSFSDFINQMRSKNTKLNIKSS